MKFPAILVLIFLSCFLVPLLLLKALKKKYSRVFDRYKRPIYLVSCLLLTGIFSLKGINNDKTLSSTITLAGAAFFGASFFHTLRQGLTEENRFGMMQLMLFVTFFAVGLGCRAIFSQVAQ